MEKGEDSKFGEGEEDFQNFFSSTLEACLGEEVFEESVERVRCEVDKVRWDIQEVVEVGRGEMVDLLHEIHSSLFHSQTTNHHHQNMIFLSPSSLNPPPPTPSLVLEEEVEVEDVEEESDEEEEEDEMGLVAGKRF